MIAALEFVRMPFTLSIAFGLGMLHAFDTDHVLAVGGLMTRRGSGVRGVALCGRWAVGHGLVVLAVAVLLFLFGVSLSESYSLSAEYMVGWGLILVGSLSMLNLLGPGKFAIRHVHQDGFAAADAATEAATGHKDHFLAMGFGMIHGLAGSATLMALIPAAQLNHPLDALGYITLFCVGVLCSMLLIGSAIGRFIKTLDKKSLACLQALRGSVALVAIVFGAYWLYQMG